MRKPSLSFALCLIASLLLCAGLQAQNVAPLTGQVTIKLIEGLDSARVQPGTASHAVVLKSTNSAIPKNAPATVLLGVDPSSGGLGVQLVQIVIKGQQVKTASTDAALSGGGILEKLTKGLNSIDSKANNQQVSLTGPHVLLPPNTVVQFTLVSLPATSGSLPTSQQAASNALNIWQPVSVPSQTKGDSPGNAVTLAGIATSGTKRGRVHLQITCFPTYFPGPSLSVAQALMDFTPTDIANFAGEGEAKIGVLKIGDDAEQTIPITPDFDNSSPSVKLRFNVSDNFYSGSYTGKPLKLSILPPNGKGTRVDATFMLPADPAPLQAVAEPCVAMAKRQTEEAARRDAETKAKIVVSCPNKPGKTLKNVNVKIMPSGRKLEPTDGDDTLLEWTLPHKAGQHAVLECTYAPDSKTAKGASVGNRVTLPIPASAVSCGQSMDMEGKNIAGDCSRK